MNLLKVQKVTDILRQELKIEICDRCRNHYIDRNICAECSYKKDPCEYIKNNFKYKFSENNFDDIALKIVKELSE